MLTLWRVADPATAVPFDRRANVGLHHLALKVTDLAALTTIHDRLRAYPVSQSNSIRRQFKKDRQFAISSARSPAVFELSSPPPQIEPR